MDTSQVKKVKCRERRMLRVRKSLRGTSTKPRLSVTKSNLNIYLQLIDDTTGHTLVSLSTLSKANKGTELAKKSKSTSRELGKAMAKLAKEKNIKTAIFDRGLRKYHGHVAEVAEGAREGGLSL